jgi:transcriptional regulator GlxA family with amidase domain
MQAQLTGKEALVTVWPATIHDWTTPGVQARFCVKMLVQRLRQDGRAISRRTFERHFVRNYGIQPKRWLLMLRIRRATAHLDTGHTIKETAVHCFYSNQQHFSRDFKNALGCPPGKYRAG